MDELLESAKKKENLNLGEVLELANKMGVEVRVTPEVKVFKGGIQGGKKVVLEVENEKELFKYKQMCEDEGLKTALIIDAGRTVVAPGTITCLGVEPCEEKDIDAITGKLKIL